MEAGPKGKAEVEAGPKEKAEAEAGPKEKAEVEAGPKGKAEVEAGMMLMEKMMLKQIRKIQMAEPQAIRVTQGLQRHRK